jgi:putative Mg2+ transporter-C (MgtC) family protein
MMDEMQILWRLLAAGGSGMLLGLNRELHGKPTGMRTLGLVGLSSAAVTCAAQGLDSINHNGTATVGNVMQGLLTGIGFLGAGVILRDAPGVRVHGLTTAATVLVTTALGIAYGIGAWVPAYIGLAAALLVLVFAGHLEHFLRRKFKSLEVEPDFNPPGND